MNHAFSLIEMVTAIALMMILIGSGVGLLSGSGGQSRKVGADMLTAMIEQARTAAITSHCYVLLAVADPGAVAGGDERCRLGLFKVQAWPDTVTDTANGVMLGRWSPLATGVVLVSGEIDGVANPLDATELTITYNSVVPTTVKVHGIAFNPRGELHYPAGTAPVVMRIAEGGYRGGKATANINGASGRSVESRLKIGRVTGRAYCIN